MALTVGMIGLGIMGSAMSENLLRAGCRVVGRDVDAARSAALSAAGASGTTASGNVAASTSMRVPIDTCDSAKHSAGRVSFSRSAIASAHRP